jgi:hypothetical protein
VSGVVAPHAPQFIEHLERELKFVVPVTRADIMRRWIHMVCRPDEQFPEADVWTVYYDTPACRSLDEKLNSDYLKTKVRARWYTTPRETGEGHAFVEVKLRVGSRRDKVRVALPMPAGVLAGRDLTDPVFQQIPRLLAAKGLVLGASWQPMLMLRYRRVRFTEPISGTRVNFDRDIAAVRVNHRYLFASHYGPLPLAVVEIKGFVDTLPARLQPLLRLGARKQSFCKYVAVYLQVRRIAV